jgi:hypothetical protein
VLLAHLIPAGAPRGLTADRAAEMLRRIRPRDPQSRRCVAWPATSSARSASSTVVSPKPPATSRPPSTHRAAP